jgi:prepilin-type N-terminal cleavage/methylation domain-containing protein
LIYALTIENRIFGGIDVEKIFGKGFSLVELMVVIGIISLLALVALPSYRNFILRAEFIETKMAVGAVKVSFEVCSQMMGLSKVKVCSHNSHGIPNKKEAADGVVGVELKGGIFDAESTADNNNKVKIVATAPTDSKNVGSTYTLTGKINASGKVLWDKGQCSKPELC